MLVGPTHQGSRDLSRPDVDLGGIHALLHRPARGPLPHVDRDTGLRIRPRHRLAQVHVLRHLPQELAHHLAAKELGICGPAHRYPLRRFEHLHAVAQRPSHPGRVPHIAGVAPGIPPRKTPRDRGGPDHCQANLRLDPRGGNRRRPLLRSTAVDGTEETCSGALLTGRLYMDEVAQLDGLANCLPLRAHNVMLSMASLLEAGGEQTACMLRCGETRDSLSTFPQRRCPFLHIASGS